MIGYHLAYENCLVGMVMTQGRQREVVNIGLGVKQLCCPPDTTVTVFAESMHHKVAHPRRDSAVALADDVTAASLLHSRSHTSSLQKHPR